MNELDKLRTVLANERTVLAYIRTALSVFVAGLAGVRLLNDSPVITALGWGSMAAGLVILFWGLVHCWIIARKIDQGI